MIDRIAKAIAQMEGANTPGNIPYRLNNPGDLVYVGQPGAKPHVITGADGKKRTFCEFITREAGMDALVHQLKMTITRHPGITLAQLIGGQRDEHGAVIPGGYPGWAPAADGNKPTAYAQFVAKECGVDVDTVCTIQP